MTWELHKTNFCCGIVALAGITQFVCAVVRAIHTMDGYSITENFLSDLGRTHSSSASLFNGSAVILGISLVPFFTAMPDVLERGQTVVRLSGVLSSLGLVGIGLTPYDKYFVAHHVALALWIGPMCMLVLSFFTIASSGGRTNVALAVGTLLVLLSVGAYAFAGSHGGHVILQKVLAILAVVWFCLVFISVTVTTMGSFPARRIIAERQARQYLQVIRRNHRRR